MESVSGMILAASGNATKNARRQVQDLFRLDYPVSKMTRRSECGVTYAVCTGKTKKYSVTPPVFTFDVTAASCCVQKLGDSIVPMIDDRRYS